MQLLQDLQDKLRAHIRARIDRGELTGSGLSREAGFQQGHLSNFLNARRGLSLESMDRLLQTLNIGVLDLADLKRSSSSVSFPQASGIRERGGGDRGASRASARFTPEQVARKPQFQQVISAPAKAQRRRQSQRLAALRALKLDAKAAGGMFPRITARRDSAAGSPLQFLAALPPLASPTSTRCGAGTRCLVG